MPSGLSLNIIVVIVIYNNNQKMKTANTDRPTVEKMSLDLAR